jgi:hypothetical protein
MGCATYSGAEAIQVVHRSWGRDQGGLANGRRSNTSARSPTASSPCTRIPGSRAKSSQLCQTCPQEPQVRNASSLGCTSSGFIRFASYCLKMRGSIANLGLASLRPLLCCRCGSCGSETGLLWCLTRCALLDNFHAKSGPGGQQSRALLEAERPPADLFVQDVMKENLWAGTGEPSHQVRKRLCLGSRPYVMVSSITIDPTERFRWAGEVGKVTPDEYFTKPLDIPHFFTTVKSLLRQSL